MLALELKELLLRLMDLVLLDPLGLDLGLGDDLVLLSFQNYSLNDYVSRQCDYSTDQDSYKKQQHNINNVKVFNSIPSKGKPTARQLFPMTSGHKKRPAVSSSGNRPIVE